MLKVILCGINGKMGQTIVNDVSKINYIEIIAGVDVCPTENNGNIPVFHNINEVKEKADVIIDFSRPAALNDILAYARKNNIGAVLATTGYTSEDAEEIEKASEAIPIFRSANMSLGVNLQIALVKKAAKVLSDQFDIEIIENHHNQKADAPSGTALMIADAINSVESEKKEIIFGRHGVNHKREDEICIHAVRGGTIVGEHEVLFLGNDEALEITHRAYSKEVFSQGAIRAAEFLADKKPGLYSMNDLLEGILD